MCSFLKIDWSEIYKFCPCFSETIQKYHHVCTIWPKETQRIEGKEYNYLILNELFPMISNIVHMRHVVYHCLSSNRKNVSSSISDLNHTLIYISKFIALASKDSTKITLCNLPVYYITILFNSIQKNWGQHPMLSVSFAQWRYRSQWGFTEARLLLVENYSQYPTQTTLTGRLV